MSSRPSPSARRFWNWSVRARRSASVRAWNRGSRALIAAPRGWRCFSSLSLESTRLPNHLSIMLEHLPDRFSRMDAGYVLAQEGGYGQDGYLSEPLLLGHGHGIGDHHLPDRRVPDAGKGRRGEDGGGAAGTDLPGPPFP